MPPFQSWLDHSHNFSMPPVVISRRSMVSGSENQSRKGIGYLPNMQQVLVSCRAVPGAMSLCGGILEPVNTCDVDIALFLLGASCRVLA